MKKILITENQVKRIIDNLINEQSSFLPLDENCDTKKLKEIKINNSGFEKNFPINSVKQKLLTATFQVFNVEGNVLLNGKEFSGDLRHKKVFITPNTTIKICGTSYMLLSGAGMDECMIRLDDGLTFIPQYA